MTLLPVSVLGAVGCGASAARLGRVAGESRATTFTRGALGAFAAIVLVEELLGAVGLLHAGALALALGAGCLLLALVARRAPSVEPPSPARPWTPLEIGLLAALLAALALRAWDALHRTTFLYDALSYHLHAPATWLHDGRVSIVPAVFGDPAPAYAPSNVELVFLFLLAPTRSAALAQAGQAPLAAIACAAIAATVREAGGPRAAALAAALAFLLVPEVWQQATSAMTDVGAAAFFLAALPFLLRLARRRVLAPGDGASDAASLGLAAGLCAGAKVVGAVFVMPLVGVAVALCARARRPARQLATLLVGAAATGAFFYVRNLVAAGNPLYPLAVKVGAAALWPGVYDAAVLRTSAYHVAPGELAALGRLLLEPGLAFALGGALALTLGARRAPAWTLLALALVGLFWLVIPYQESRFLFPLWGVVTIATAAFGRAETDSAAAVWTWAPLTLAVAGSVVEQPTAERWAVLGVGTAVAAGSAWSRPWRERRSVSGARSLPKAAAVGVAVGVAVLAALALDFAPKQAAAYALGDELDEAWAWFGANVRGARVAYTGNNLAFPLTGAGLSNDVRYINVAGAPGALLHDFARVAPAGPEPAPYREGARYETWLSNLRVARRDVLFVAALDPAVRRTIAADDDGFPVERIWADAHPGVFTLRFASAAARVYGVSP